MLRSFKQLASEPDMAAWFAKQHPVLMKQGLGSGGTQ